jgi:hypothetical protein
METKLDADNLQRPFLPLSLILSFLFEADCLSPFLV